LLATTRVSAHTAALLASSPRCWPPIFAFTPSKRPTSTRHGLWGQTMLAAAANGAAFGLFPIG